MSVAEDAAGEQHHRSEEYEISWDDTGESIIPVKEISDELEKSKD